MAGQTKKNSCGNAPRPIRQQRMQSHDRAFPILPPPLDLGGFISRIPAKQNGMKTNQTKDFDSGQA